MIKTLSFLFKRDFHVSSVAQSCPTLCDPMDCSTPGLPVHHQLPELAQTHIQRVSDAIQPSHPLSSPSPPAFTLSSASGSFPMSQSFTLGGQNGHFKRFLSTSDPCKAKTVVHQDPFTQTIFIHGTDRNGAPIVLGTKQVSKYRELLVGSAHEGLPCGSVVKNPPTSAGDMGLIPDPRGSHMPQSN